MTEQDLAYIEQELDIQLPEAYKKEALGPNLVGTVLEPMFLNDAKRIVSVNKRFRRWGMLGTAWQHNHFIFGLDISPRGYHYIDVDESEATVYFTNYTKYRRYRPDNKHACCLGPIPISEFVRWHVDLVRRRNRPVPPDNLTDEEKQAKREAYLAELLKQKDEQKKD